MNVEIESKWMSVDELRNGVGGTVYLPGDAGYDAARMAWNLVVTQEPQVIVDAETAVDVQLAVRFARSNGMAIGVMATGHGMPRGCDGVLIRTARMAGVRIDPETRLARVQGGALVKDVLTAAQPYGLAMLSGSTLEVGVVGYTLGGGFGLMIRKHGLAVDRVRSARIVTPDGDLVTASPDENSDLFWAIRGGGGAFGVIVEMTMELVPQATVYGGATIYPAENVEALVKAYANWAKEQPEEVTSTIMLMNLPSIPFVPEVLRGRSVVVINGCVCGDLEGAEEAILPIRNLGAPIIDAWGAFPYVASGCIYNDPTEPMPCLVQGVVLGELSEESIDRMLEAIGPIDRMPQVAVQLRHIGGAAGRVPHDAMPIGRMREAAHMIYTIGVPNPFVSAAAIGEHSEAIFSSLREEMLCRGPLNFLGEGQVRASTVCDVYHERDYARLGQVKRTVDPENMFRFASVGLIDED